ncbi:unnamed protein product [Rhizoctonia solani]|uniref:Transmembrane protein n=1 Tax=Rhizoctonia solani TaxID=456999 RepID=A0A8H3C456_9AGAM|nr:unnamed protein product [Rhizoctonia solani]
MVNNERTSVVEGSSNRPSGDREERPRGSDETLVGRLEAGPLPTKQGELGYVPPPVVPLRALNENTDQSQPEIPVRHPADHTPSPTNPNPETTPTQHPNASTTSLPSSFKQFLRTPRPLPTIHGVRSTTVLRVVFTTFILIATIVGWVVTVVRMNAWDKKGSVFAPPPPQSINSGEGNNSNTPPPDPLDQMTHSSLVFVHVAFGASVLFLLLMLERSVYRFRAERYAHLHPEEMATTTEVNGVMGLSPWNRPPLPSYAAALGVRGTGDVEDNVIAAPPPPEYGNTRGSTLLLTSRHLAGSQSRSTSTSRPGDEDRRDALGRPVRDWSRPVSYAEDEMRENLRRSLDLEAALARLEGPSRPESALTRR